MNRLKRIYVMLYIAGAVWLLSFSIDQLIRDDHWLGWAGVTLTVAPILLVLGLAMLTRRVARTSGTMPVALILGLIGLVMAMVESHILGGPRWLPAYALAGLLGFSVYNFWYSRFGRTPSAVLETGNLLPEFDLTGVDGGSVSSAALTAERPTVIAFIRGNWCPLCMGQVNEMAAGLGPFIDAAIPVIFVAPQNLAKTRALAKGRPAGMSFYADRDNQAARTLRIQNPDGLPFGMEILGYRSETVLPTMIVTAPGGRIVWTHQTDNYRVRPKPDEVLAVAIGLD